MDYIESAKSEWIIVYTDGSFERFLLVDKYTLESSFNVNAYIANLNRYQLYQENIEHGNGEWKRGDRDYFEVKNELTITKLLDFKFTFHSRFIMEQNVKNRRIVPNGRCYGQGKVQGLTRKFIL
ncbi:MAG TPA: hypothetical protein VHE34_00455 [Puia sp.]|uniref:hypothetical protein n=1 Tax=Puia sp. TaxID=2045100 RepID=UPI002BB110D5|nr:hypothetical protein [Puia sp.]HVU93655.1 hypothetical protein [Puia sp.]